MQFLKREALRFVAAYDAFDRDGGSHLAAAAAYFIGLSLFPLLSVLVACVGWVLNSTSPGQNAEEEVMRTVGQHVSPIVALQVQEMLAQVRENSSVSGPIGFAMLLITSLAGFSQFEQAFDRIWNVPHRGSTGFLGAIRSLVFERLVAALMLLCVGGLVVLTFVASTVMATLQARTRDLLPTPDSFWTLVQSGTSLVINATAFTMLYHWLPRPDVSWKDAGRGGLVVAIAWEAGRQILAAFLIGTKYSSAYGVVGTFLGLLVWCYYACMILFLGAEYVRSFELERNRAATEAAGTAK